MSTLGNAHYWILLPPSNVLLVHCNNTTSTSETLTGSKTQAKPTRPTMSSSGPTDRVLNWFIRTTIYCVTQYCIALMSNFLLRLISHLYYRPSIICAVILFTFYATLKIGLVLSYLVRQISCQWLLMFLEWRSFHVPQRTHKKSKLSLTPRIEWRYENTITFIGPSKPAPIALCGHQRSGFKYRSVPSCFHWARAVKRWHQNSFSKSQTLATSLSFLSQFHKVKC